MQNFRKEFPVLRNYIYANTAASGLMYDGLLEWRQEHDLDFLIGGSTMKMAAMSNLLPEARTTVASFFNCTVQNTALVPNFSLGINVLLEGLDKKHNILLLENDYPSVNWPFEQRRFKTFYAKLDEHVEERIFERIKADNITVFAFSLIQWLNGIQIELDFLKKLKASFPNLIIIADGTQFCGTSNFDFEDSAIDVLGASAYKWLLAGFGNGFILFKDHIKKEFKMKSSGFNAADADLDGKDDIRFAKHFEPGHLDTLNFGSLKFSLDFLASLGMGAVEEQLAHLAGHAKEAFMSLNLLEDAVVHKASHSTIFNIKGDERLLNHLQNNNVVCAQRGKGIRLSFHFYNTLTDIDTIVKILKDNI